MIFLGILFNVILDSLIIAFLILQEQLSRISIEWVFWVWVQEQLGQEDVEDID